MSAPTISEPRTDSMTSDFDLDIRTSLRDLEDDDRAMEAKSVSIPHGPLTSSCFCPTFLGC